MSGSKIKAAIENIQMIVQNNIHEQDYVLLITFNRNVFTKIPITRKGGNERMILDTIAAQIRPDGGTGLSMSYLTHDFVIYASCCFVPCSFLLCDEGVFENNGKEAHTK